MKQLIMTITGLLLMLRLPLYAASVNIPGLIPIQYQGQSAYTNSVRDPILVANAIDMGGTTNDLGAKLTVAQVLANIGTRLNGKQPDKINSTGLTGIYELYYGEQVHYVDGTGRYIFKNARLISADGEDLSQQATLAAIRNKAAQNLSYLSQIADNEMLVYPAQQEQSWITVFTDLDCPYCSRIHSEIDTYRKSGISVRYLFFPRAGEQSTAYSTFVNVWCSEDRYTALEKAEAGLHITSKKTCPHPVDKHLQVAWALNLTATPVMVLAQGTMLYGYQHPETVIKLANFHNNRK